jgi:hypothetical protein
VVRTCYNFVRLERIRTATNIYSITATFSIRCSLFFSKRDTFFPLILDLKVLKTESEMGGLDCIKITRVVEPQYSDAALAPGKIYYVAPAPAPTLPELPYITCQLFQNNQQLTLEKGQFFFFVFLLIQIVTKLNGKSKKLLQFVTFFIIHLCFTSSLKPGPKLRYSSDSTKMMRFRLRNTEDYHLTTFDARTVLQSVLRIRIRDPGSGAFLPQGSGIRTRDPE